MNTCLKFSSSFFNMPNFEMDNLNLKWVLFDVDVIQVWFRDS